VIGRERGYAVTLDDAGHRIQHGVHRLARTQLLGIATRVPGLPSHVRGCPKSEQKFNIHFRVLERARGTNAS
jgi:hypothetical protein